MTWQATVLTLFPGMFPGPLGASLAGKALEERIWGLEALDIRGFASDKHASVDDTPFGGGAGMVMRPDVLDRALASVEDRPGPRIYLSPRGRLLDQARVKELAQGPGVVLLCGRYEGVDERVSEALATDEISIGDYVLSGGELPALVLIDAVARLVPGVVGDAASVVNESFADGLLDYPHYTRPAVFRGLAVPDVLVSGNHGEIERWRAQQRVRRTEARRPDLLNERDKGESHESD